MKMPTPVASFIAALLLLVAPQANAAKLKFGVSTEYSAEHMEKHWKPILEAIGKDSGLELELSLSPDIPAYYARFEKGEFDFALINQRIFGKSKKYHAAARPDAKLQGILVVGKDSVYKELKDLKGKKVAFPSPDSYAATIINQGDLTAAGADFTPVYPGSHEGVYEAVASGTADAGGGVMRIFIQLKPETSAKLRILHMTKTEISHPFVINEKVSAGDAEKLKASLLKLGTDPKGKAMLKAVGLAPLVEAKDADYDGARKS